MHLAPALDRHPLGELGMLRFSGGDRAADRLDQRRRAQGKQRRFLRAQSRRDITRLGIQCNDDAGGIEGDHRVGQRIDGRLQLRPIGLLRNDLRRNCRTE
jgi:hypothetical protein